MIREIVLNTGISESIITCGEGALQSFASSFDGKVDRDSDRGKVVVVTDSNVFKLYESVIKSTFGKEVGIFVLKAGEKSKTYKNLLSIIEFMLKSGLKRNGLVVAFGGGVVGDIAGLAASLYMRGVKLIQVPTTLLSQVDSSVGGKTAVDFGEVKNLIGTFYQPQRVIVDSMFLDTLPKRELRCGLGEIVKYAALNEEIYQILKGNLNKFFKKSFLESITYHCIMHKKRVVEGDERDSGGERKSLNLGHTTGHAFELKYGKKSHGEYVLIGMYYELYIAVQRHICGGQYAQTLQKMILKVLKDIPEFSDVESAACLAVFDKKNTDENISLIVPKQEGVYEELKLPISEYISYLSTVNQNIKEQK